MGSIEKQITIQMGIEMDVNELVKIKEEINGINDKLKKLRDNNYTELYNKMDLRYIEEMRRTLFVSSATVATYIDKLESENRWNKLKSKG